MIRNKFNVFQKHTKIFVKVDIANMAGILKYFAGAKPGIKRKPEGDSHSESQKRKNYELSKRYRSFMTHWKIGRAWLEYDQNVSMMKCTACAKFYENKPFKEQWKLWVNGTPNFKIDTI